MNTKPLIHCKPASGLDLDPVDFRDTLPQTIWCDAVYEAIRKRTWRDALRKRKQVIVTADFSRVTCPDCHYLVCSALSRVERVSIEKAKRMLSLGLTKDQILRVHQQQSSDETYRRFQFWPLVLRR